jgi:hypothetical protein
MDHLDTAVGLAGLLALAAEVTGNDEKSLLHIRHDRDLSKAKREKMAKKSTLHTSGEGSGC